MATPLAHGLFHKAIGESGAYFPAGPRQLGAAAARRAEQAGREVRQRRSAPSRSPRCARSRRGAAQAAIKTPARGSAPNIDGYCLREERRRDLRERRAGARCRCSPAGMPTRVRAASTLRPAEADGPDLHRRRRASGSARTPRPSSRPIRAATDAEALESAAALASDTFIGYSTWKWLEMQAQTGQRAGVPLLVRSQDPGRRPTTRSTASPATSADIGARHAGEIEYVFGALESVPKVTWEPSDRALSDAMMSYWANFAKTGDPNGAGLPTWPRYDPKAGRCCTSTRRSRRRPTRSARATRRSTRSSARSADVVSAGFRLSRARRTAARGGTATDAIPAL